jgi:hypothetical protein
MSFRNKVRAKHRALGLKAKMAGAKSLTRFQKGRDIPRQPPNQGRAKWHLDPK